MRAPLYLACWAVFAFICVDAEERRLDRLDLAADPETLGFLLPRLAAKYRPSPDWTGVTDPRFYLLTEMEEGNGIDEQNKKIRNKRYEPMPREERFYNTDYQPNLSINAPITSLRKAYNQERLRQRIIANRKFLENLTDFN